MLKRIAKSFIKDWILYLYFGMIAGFVLYFLNSEGWHNLPGLLIGFVLLYYWLGFLACAISKAFTGDY